VPDAEQTCESEVALVVLQLIVKPCHATIAVCEGLMVGFGVAGAETDSPPSRLRIQNARSIIDDSTITV
jgi:hypothetical protein